MKSFKERISQIYYTHGLFCASHPYSIIISVIITSACICYPLTNLPLPGNAPVKYITPLEGYKVPPRVQPMTKHDEQDLANPRWYVGKPNGYIQQIVFKATVSPWKSSQMISTDAFRAPLSLLFKTLEQINNLKVHVRGEDITLSDLCLRVSEVVTRGKVKGLLPEYSCLLVSPANLWQNQETKFSKDADLLKTIFRRYGQPLETAPYVKDLLFGIPWFKSGISHYAIRNKERPVSFAITIVLKRYDPVFTEALRVKLESLYPDTMENVNNTEIHHMVHYHYKDINYFAEYTYLFVTYFVLLLYLYFSVKKIEMVKSKWGLAISAVAMVIASLLVSVSICTFFGMTPKLKGSEIFPYLVVIIGVENVVVLTKSVVSTPVHLDVKYRVAQGLSKEGWFVTKNLVLELGIILVGFFTFVPAIQEFCLFAVVGLASDFFLQMVFFVTVLSVDIRRMELSDLHKQSVLQSVHDNQEATVQIEPLYRCPVASKFPSIANTPKIHKSKSDPRLDSQGDPHGTPPPSPGGHGDDTFFPSPAILELPRRLKFLYFWARTRIFQRLIMVCTVIWIALIVYKSGLVDTLTSQNESIQSNNPHPTVDSLLKAELLAEKTSKAPNEGMWGMGRVYEYDDGIGPVEHTELELFDQLSYKHWQTLFGHYNISLLGSYVSILPAIHVSAIIDPDTAIKIRHPADMQSNTELHSPNDNQPITHSNTLKAEDSTNELSDYTHMYDAEQLKLFIPKSEKEYIITVCFGILSVIVITYFMVVMYKCMCSRNYAKWRSSWAKVRRHHRKGVNRFIKESIPLVLRGHNQDIECITTDGQLVISACLGGELRVWDSNSGECISTLNRKSIIPPRRRKPCLGRNIEDSDADLYAEYHGDSFGMESTGSSDTSLSEKSRSLDYSRHNRFENEPDLSSTISFDFSTPDPVTPKLSEISKDGDASASQGYDFKSRFNKVYEEHWQLVHNADPTTFSRDNRIHSAELSGHDWENILSPRLRSLSTGEIPWYFDDDMTEEIVSAVWCLACREGLIVVGCGNGRVEIWEAEAGILKSQYEMKPSGVTAISFTGNSVIVARLDGSIDFLALETFRNPITPPPVTTSSTPRQHRGHVRSSSEVKVYDEILRCVCHLSVKAHQRPINALQSEGGRVVSASQDHTLKVFRLEDCLCLYTLHGHEGSVTALSLDKLPPYSAVSGSTDGRVRLWDLLTGSCVYMFHGHDGAVSTVTSTLQFVISVGGDDKLCVWDRHKGQLIHSMSIYNCCGSSICLLSNSLVVTGSQGKLYLCDIVKGEIVREVQLKDSDQAAFVRRIKSVGSMSIVCDFGKELEILHFPTILEKRE
ncbi:sterol regulatory element-binding protein cleavage-activating protein [Patella vulgata]|uniref:sterol regulatory element-binding protein cleavage-activating protein n=1 Tax=Patella vulgata TaxID=6465 RepID=UPI0024A8121D|nr:sterol regulatory element-binding protein cleavage-activating protein [Patella vulgata]